MDSPAPARFVTIDGPSAVGKTTACSQVATILASAGCDVTTTSTPSASDIGGLARHGTFRLSGHALSCLVASDRYHHRATVVQPALDTAQTVLCDRYVPSAFVLDVADGVTWDFVAALYSELPAPDLAIVLMGDPALCAARSRERNSAYSRLHPTTEPQFDAEHDNFRTTVDLLSEMRYPVYRIDIGLDDPAVVAARIAEALLGAAVRGVAAEDVR